MFRNSARWRGSGWLFLADRDRADFDGGRRGVLRRWGLDLDARRDGYAVLFGICWATATGCVGLALKKYGAQISQPVPLYNKNTLIAVAIGLIAFAEWRTVQPLRISLAAVLIVSGGVWRLSRERRERID